MKTQPIPENFYALDDCYDEPEPVTFTARTLVLIAIAAFLLGLML